MRSPLLALVLIHHPGLHPDRRGNHLLQGSRIAPQHVVRVLFHEAHQRPVADDPRLHALHQPGAQLAVRQRPQHSNIGKNCQRMMKAADKILALGQVHARLAAHA
jgi:hypothetical protein